MITIRPAFSRRKGKLNSFSLVELLVVIAIGAILSVLSVTAFSKITRATNITSSAQSLSSGLNLARQTAVARNTDVEFRLYELPDQSAGYAATPQVYRAFQTFLITDGNATNQLTTVTFLPNQAIVSPLPAATTVMGLTVQNGSSFTVGNSTTSSPVVLPNFGNNYKALTFRFSPNGGLEATTPALTTWTMTLYLESDAKATSGNTTIPADFATIQIDPFNGAASVFRP